MVKKKDILAERAIFETYGVTVELDMPDDEDATTEGVGSSQHELEMGPMDETLQSFHDMGKVAIDADSVLDAEIDDLQDTLELEADELNRIVQATYGVNMSEIGPPGSRQREEFFDKYRKENNNG